MTSLNSLVPIGWEAQIHRETYIAVLQGHLRRRGAKRAFAAKVGISPQYLSYLLDPYNHRTPSQATAEAIVSALPIDDHQRGHLLEHIMKAAQQDALSENTLRQTLSHGTVQESLQEIRRLDASVQFGGDACIVRSQRRVTAAAGKLFLRMVDPWQSPLAYAEVALILHELNSAQNHHSLALAYARQARFVLSIAQNTVGQVDAERFDNCVTNAMRLEAVAYANLNLSQRAYRLLGEAEQTAAARKHPGDWLPHLYRDKLQAISHLPHASIAEAESLTQRGVRALEKTNNSNAPLLAVMLQRSLGNVYLHRARVDAAAQVAERLNHDMAFVSGMGMVHRALILRDYVHVLWHQGKYGQWAEALGKTLALAQEAGLTHQLAQLRHRYGAVPTDALALLTPAAQELLQPVKTKSLS